MTELRTITPLSYSFQLLQAMDSVMRNINGLKQFLNTLAEKGTHLASETLMAEARTGIYPLHHD
jgi:hypothetical protein